jgi:hypothetical protein
LTDGGGGLQGFLDFGEEVLEELLVAGLVKDIQPNLKQYIDQHDSGAVSEEKRDALRTKFFASRLEEELDEAGYKQFLKDLLTEIKEAL